MNRGFLVGNRFLEPASILAIRLVLVRSDAYIIANDKPGIVLESEQDSLEGRARIGNVAE